MQGGADDVAPLGEVAGAGAQHKLAAAAGDGQAVRVGARGQVHVVTAGVGAGPREECGHVVGPLLCADGQGPGRGVAVAAGAFAGGGQGVAVGGYRVQVVAVVVEVDAFDVGVSVVADVRLHAAQEFGELVGGDRGRGCHDASPGMLWG